MKIGSAVYYPVLREPRGGGSLRLAELYLAMCNLHDDTRVKILSACGKDPYSERLGGVSETCSLYTAENIQVAQSATDKPSIAGWDIGAMFSQQAPYDLSLLQDCDVVMVEEGYMWPHVRTALKGKTKLVYNSFNIEWKLKQALHGDTRYIPLLKEYERQAVTESDLVVCCSSLDMKYFHGEWGAPWEKLLLINNGVNTHKFRDESLSEESSPVVSFVGSWHIPNINAGKWINIELAPKFPHVQFQLIGTHTRRISSPALNVTLFDSPSDEELSLLLQRSHIALNPVQSGSGTNIKIPTYLATGTPVITTYFGARGHDVLLNHMSVCVLDQFTQKISNILGNYSHFHSQAKVAAGLVRQSYGWDSLAERLHSHLLSL